MTKEKLIGSTIITILLWAYFFWKTPVFEWWKLLFVNVVMIYAIYKGVDKVKEEDGND